MTGGSGEGAGLGQALRVPEFRALDAAVRDRRRGPARRPPAGSALGASLCTRFVPERLRRRAIGP